MVIGEDVMRMLVGFLERFSKPKFFYGLFYRTHLYETCFISVISIVVGENNTHKL
jgi:uncharacterized membrane protein